MSQDPIVLDTTGTDIQGESARIRARGPVALVELPGGVPAWSVTDQAVLKSLLADSRVSKDPRQHWSAFLNGEITEAWPLLPWIAVENMFTAYGADHRRLRKLVSPAFTHRRTTAMRERIEGIVAELLTNLAAVPAGEVVDLRKLYAYPVPIQTISGLLGVPEHLDAAIHKCVDGFFDGSFTAEQSMANFLEMYERVGELVTYRREHPGDDITSAMIAERDEDGSPLTDKELVETLMLVVNMRPRDHRQPARSGHRRPAHPSRAARGPARGPGAVVGSDRGDAALPGARRAPAAALRGRGHRRRRLPHPQG